jgi:hypothetical protein
MKIKSGFVLRVVGGENVVVPVGEMSKAFHGMINLNETGAFLWRFFSEEHTLEDAIEALCNEYEGAEREQVEADVNRFADVLTSNGFCE